MKRYVVNLLFLLCFALFGCASIPTPGTPSAEWPHLLADGNGAWYPAPGYSWNHRDKDGYPPRNDWSVHWEPGKTYWYLGKTYWPHVVACNDEGRWCSEPGYTWLHLDQNGKPIPGDFAVYWKPGIKFYYRGKEYWPHVVASNNEGNWRPEQGYTWVHRDANGKPIPGDFAVQLKPPPVAPPPTPPAPIPSTPSSSSTTAQAFQRGQEAAHRQDYATALREWQPLAPSLST
jgi:hypothetical protein